MEAAVRKHVSMLLHYNTSTVCNLSTAQFLELVGPFMQAPTDPTKTPPGKHALSALLVSPSDHFPDPALDTRVAIARDESYRRAENYLATHLYAIPLEGVGLQPHETSLAQLTERTVDAVIEHGLFGSALVVLDALVESRGKMLRQCLRERLGQQRPGLSSNELDRMAAMTTLVPLSKLATSVPGEVTRLILDMAHLLGSNEHYTWAHYVKTQQDKDRALSVLAMGWKNVPSITPGWSLNTHTPIAYDAVIDMLDAGPWSAGRNPTDAPRYRTHAALIRLNKELSSVKSGLFLLVRGNSDGMEAAKFRVLKRELGDAATTLVGLNDLPLTLLRQPVGIKPVLVLPTSVGEKMNLDHWMLLLSHAQSTLLVLMPPKDQEIKDNPQLEVSPVEMIKTWIQNKRTVSVSLTMTVHEATPW